MNPKKVRRKKKYETFMGGPLPLLGVILFCLLGKTVGNEKYNLMKKDIVSGEQNIKLIKDSN